MKQAWGIKIRGYVPENMGFRDEGWDTQTLFFKHRPTLRDIKEWIICTEIEKWEIIGQKFLQEVGEFTYIKDN